MDSTLPTSPQSAAAAASRASQAQAPRRFDALSEPWTPLPDRIEHGVSFEPHASLVDEQLRAFYAEAEGRRRSDSPASSEANFLRSITRMSSPRTLPPVDVAPESRTAPAINLDALPDAARASQLGVVASAPSHPPVPAGAAAPADAADAAVSSARAARREHQKEKNRRAQAVFRKRQKTKIAGLEGQVDDLHARLVAKDDEIGDLRARNASKDDEITRLRAENAELRRERKESVA